MTLKEKALRNLSGLFLSDYPRELQIQTVSRCNAKCIFCPNTTLSEKLTHGRMGEDLFRRIMDDCLPRRPAKVKPYLMNEPLVDRRLPSLIRYITDNKHPSTKTEIYTNAGLLDEGMAHGLVESGLDRLIVSFQGIDPGVYERTMVGLKYDSVLANIEGFLKAREAAGSRGPYFEIRMVNTGFTSDQIGAHREFWRDRGVRLVVKPLENRLDGQIEGAGLEVKRWNSRAFCRRLFAYAWILFNGDMILCCCDWERRHVLGNAGRDTISEIWHGEAYREIRRKFVEGDVGDIVCRDCKVDG